MRPSYAWIAALYLWHTTRVAIVTQRLPAPSVSSTHWQDMDACAYWHVYIPPWISGKRSVVTPTGDRSFSIYCLFQRRSAQNNRIRVPADLYRNYRYARFLVTGGVGSGPA